MKKLYFLSGLPRSGSTLLGSLLNQHPEIYVSPTSPLADLIVFTEASLNDLEVQYTFDKEKISYNVYSSLLSNFYNHISKPNIIDKHRAWPKNLENAKKFISNDIKVILTYRSIPEIITSYISLIERSQHHNNFIDDHLRSKKLSINNDNRAEYIWSEYVYDPYQSAVIGINRHPEMIHLVEYNQLVQNPQEELNKIYKFLEIPSYQNNFYNIENSCGEKKDEMWGIRGLHDIRPKIERISKNPMDVIGEENVKLYSKLNLI